MGLAEWSENLRRRSAQTAEVYGRVLRQFCRHFNVEPEDLVVMDEGDVRDMLLSFIRDKEGKSAGYLNTVIYAVKSWLEHNGRTLSLKVYLEKKSNNETTPTRDDVREVLLHANLRQRVVVALMAFSGLRPRSIGTADGQDGIKLGDLPDLNLEELRFERIPAQIVVRSELNKAKTQYVTFAGPQTCSYILAYLRTRKELDEGSPLVASRRERHLATSRVRSEASKAIKLAGLDFRPYLLRHYFDTQLLLAEAAGVIPEDYRVFWMGHKGDIEAVYTTNKHRLSPQLLEDMREKFLIASKLLETERAVESRQKQKVVTAEEIADYLEMGWEYVATLPDGRVIIKSP